MNLLPLRQNTTASDILLDEDTPPPPTQAPAFFLHRLYSDTKDRWEMLTGLSFQTSTPEEIAEVFRKVVKKHAEKPGEQRDAFSEWEGHLVTAPTPSEQELAEQQVRSGNVQVLTGSIIEGVSPEDNNVPVMHVDYYVTVDPVAVRAEIPEEPTSSAGLSDRTKVAGAAGLLVGGLATSLLVKKGVGLKLLAGFVGGVIVAGVFMEAAQATERREVA